MGDLNCSLPTTVYMVITPAQRRMWQKDGAAQFSESDTMHHQFRHHRGDIREDRKLQRHKAFNAGSSLHGDPVKNTKISTTGQMNPSLLAEKTPPQESLISQVPLRLQIKVSGQRGSLGISIAGGKGSLPYKDHDEDIFISRVSRGGPSEKAGLHVGDRLIEVNGFDMQGATHHAAVSALRNAGSCIKMKVLRERMLPREVCGQDNPVAQEMDTFTDRQLYNQDVGCQRSKPRTVDSSVDCLPGEIEAVICNGNGISDLQIDPNWTLFEREPEASMENNTLQEGKNTMTIPRIILTHPSTSDEDVDPLSQGLDGGALEDFGFPDDHIHSDSFNSAFYPP
ncbi:protein scribble homolog [Polymixia lowei]